MKNFYILIFALLLPLLSHAQIPELKFREVPGQEKLSSQFTTCITQDSIGYIWIGTVDGLNRYDGHEMKIYRNSQESYPNLANNNIRTLFPDSKGRIWVGTIWGLSIYVPENDAFELLSSSANPAGLESSFIYQIDEDDDGVFYIAAGKAIYLFDEESRQFTKLIEVSEGDITSFHLFENGTIWTGQDSGGGLKRFMAENDYRKSNLPEWISQEDSALFAVNTISSIKLSDSLLWVATRGNGLKKIDLRNKAVKSYLAYTEYNSFVIDLYQDHSGNIWSCDFSGLKRYDPQADTFYEYYPEADNQHSIKRNPISIYQDHQENYWVIYSEKGIAISPVDRGFQLFDDSPDSYWKLFDVNVMSITEDNDGNLWTGGYNEGITVFHWEDDSTTTFEFSSADTCSLGQGTIFDLHLDNAGDIWAGTYMGGLQRYDSQTQCFVSFRNDPDNDQSINGNDIRSIAEDSIGNFWLAVHGEGIDYFDRKTGAFSHYTPQNSDLSINWTNQVMIDSQKNIWVATSYGLNKLKASDKTFDVYISNGINDSKSLNSDDIICLKESKDGTIWIGTTNGLHSYDSLNDDFIFHSQSFNNQYICSIENDAKGNLWVTTHGGLTRYEPASGRVFNFDSGDGLQSNDFNIRSSYFGGDQHLFFGGPAGLNFFKPQDINYNLDPPIVVFTNFRLFNEPVTEFGEDKPLSKHISVADKITMDYRNKFFTIEYTAINFINPDKNTYAYRLDGFEDRWNMAGNKREATYTNLNPGTYRFRVKAANNDGVWNEEGASIEVIILPAWYMTTWFKIMIVVSVFILIYLVFQYRTSVLRRQKMALTSLVNERTKKIHEKNQMLKARANDLDNSNKLLEKQKQTIQNQSSELEEQAKQLKISNKELHKLNSTKDRLFSVIAHDVRAPFNTIIGFSSILREMAADGNIDLTVEYAQYIHDSSNQVLALLENLLYWARSQTNEITMKPKKTSLKNIFDDNIKLLNDTAIRKNIIIDTSQLDYGIEFFADEDMLRTVVRNLLSNAIKFTPSKGWINLIANVKDENLVVLINDTGNGINEDNVRKLKNTNLLYTTRGTHGEKGSGLGLTISREFVEHHNGSLIIESTLGNGSSFGFTIPLNNKS